MRHIMALCLIAMFPSMASAQGKCLGWPHACSSTAGCDCSQKICCPQVETEKIKQQTYEVECKQICVPPVRCPWSKCCEPRCACAKTVHVLKKREIECGEKCVWKWKLEEARSANCNACVQTPVETPLPTPAYQEAPASPATAPRAATRRFSLRELFD